MAKILGVRIDNVGLQEVIAKITAFLLLNGCRQIATVNPEFVVMAQKDPEFKAILSQTDVSVADGKGIILAARFLGQKIKERITGVDLTWEICKLAAEKGFSVYFLGAAEGIAAKAAKRIAMIHPGLKIAGFYAGTPQEEGLVERINKTNPDILLVAYGAPKQEKFIWQNRERLNCKVAMGVGGTFDYIAGIVPYAPLWLRKLGLEWFYRLLTQPRRFKRILAATVVFPWLVIKSRFLK